MAFNKDSIKGTLLVATLLCLVCSIIVASAAISLRDLQNENKANNKRQAVLQAAGIYNPDVSVAEQFSQIQTRLVNLETGRFATETELQALRDRGFQTDNFDENKASKTPGISKNLGGHEDIASIKRMSNYASVYFVENKDGQVETLVIPVHGYGLWSTLYGFIAIESDLNTVVGLIFYEHAETPGMGGEVDNPRWKAQWQGKHLYNEAGELAITVVKGVAEKTKEGRLHQVDGLSGASLTSRGVTNLVHFWLGDSGFGDFLVYLKEQGV